jgi:hypothetical protein
MYENLLNLQSGMDVLKLLLKSANRRSVKDVSLYEINVISLKITSLVELERKKGVERMWIEMVRGRRKSEYINDNILFQTSVIKNHYELLAPKE